MTCWQNTDAGLRLSSLCWLDAEDVDVEVDVGNAQLHVQLKGRRRMVIGLPAELGRELLAHACSQLGPLFRSRRGDRLSPRQVQTRFAGWVQVAGIGRITPHVLRHTYGTRLYRETPDLRRVQQALGHRCVETTERYVAV